MASNVLNRLEFGGKFFVSTEKKPPHYFQEMNQIFHFSIISVWGHEPQWGGVSAPVLAVMGAFLCNAIVWSSNRYIVEDGAVQVSMPDMSRMWEGNLQIPLRTIQPLSISMASNRLFWQTDVEARIKYSPPFGHTLHRHTHTQHFELKMELQ